MNYSTQALTESLQKIAQEERDVKTFKQASAKPIETSSPKTLEVSYAADAFLEERREFQVKAQSANFGRY
jgi:hypothetical protein